MEVCRFSIFENFFVDILYAGAVISFLVTRCAFLWTPRVYGRHSPKLAALRHWLGAVTSAALITKCLLSSLQNDMPPLRWYIEQKFPYAIRLLDNGRWISSENMERLMISTILYLHIKWKYVANRLIIFSCKGGAPFAAIIARLPLWSLR